jgi:hypothetical protein
VIFYGWCFKKDKKVERLYRLGKFQQDLPLAMRLHLLAIFPFMLMNPCNRIG